MMISLPSLIDIFVLALFANWVTHWFQPFNYFRDIIVECWTNWTINNGWYGLQPFVKVITCSKCFGFWFTLIYLQNFWAALVVSFVAYLIKLVIDRVEHWYE